MQAPNGGMLGETNVPFTRLCTQKARNVIHEEWIELYFAGQKTG